MNSDSKNPDRANSNSNDCNAARSIALSQFRTQQLVSLEQQLNVLIDEVGALERIKATPLPLVYVTHLRTWLMLFLLTLPYFWEASLGYAMIPVECLAAFALLGLEGAAAEVGQRAGGALAPCAERALGLARAMRTCVANGEGLHTLRIRPLPLNRDLTVTRAGFNENWF